jgi:hypothetical protein
VVEDRHPRVTGDWPISPDDTDWVAATRSSGAAHSANGFELGFAAIPHSSKAIRGETQSSRTSHLVNQNPLHKGQVAGWVIYNQ